MTWISWRTLQCLHLTLSVVFMCFIILLLSSKTTPNMRKTTKFFIVVSPYVVRVYVAGVRPAPPKSFGSKGLRHKGCRYLLRNHHKGARCFLVRWGNCLRSIYRFPSFHPHAKTPSSSVTSKSAYFDSCI